MPTRNVYVEYGLPYRYDFFFDIENVGDAVRRSASVALDGSGYDYDTGEVRITLDRTPADAGAPPALAPFDQTWPDSEIHVFGSGDVITGTSQRDHIIGDDRGGSALGDSILIQGRIIDGRGGDDRLQGRGGDDVLVGGGGGDLLFGDGGSDTAQYFRGVRADLGNPSRNTGEARGDRYFSIENLAGYWDDDDLRGNSGRNKLFGDGGDDELYGRHGNDELWGGQGNDILDGGPGADRLEGGSGRDTAKYTSGSVFVDLANPGRNRGEAAGDRYSSIEDVLAGDGNDTLLGNGGGNALKGDDGHDGLFGQGGNDTLMGGSGNDTLLGAAGVDTVWGGSGSDRFVFRKGSGHDRIADFENNRDRIEIDRSLARSVDAALDRAVQDGSDVAFYFSNGDNIRVDDVQLSWLADDILIV